MIRSRTRVLLPFLLLALVVALAGCGGDQNSDASATTPGAGEATTEAAATTAQPETGNGDRKTLKGSVGPGFVISLPGAGSLTAGDYTLVVDDKSSIHNFHLTGPGGVDVATEIVDEGQMSFEITLVPGTYTYVCDPHASSMNGTFTVS